MDATQPSPNRTCAVNASGSQPIPPTRHVLSAIDGLDDRLIARVDAVSKQAIEYEYRGAEYEYEYDVADALEPWDGTEWRW